MSWLVSSIDQAVSDLADEFALLPDWEERISHVIELGAALEPLTDAERNEQTRVRGCTSQVWLVSERRPDAPEKADRILERNAHLVRGEVAMLLRIFCGRTPSEILAADPPTIFERLGLQEALTPQRSNGLFAMMNRIQAEARAAA